MTKRVCREERLQFDLMDKVSYEFKDSLTSIIGFSQIIKNNCRNQDQIKLIGNVLTSSERLLTFVNNVASFANFVSEHYQKNSNQFSLSELSCEILSSFDSVVRKKELVLQSEFPDFKIQNDHQIVSQVLYNIFDHILKIAPQNGAIFLKISKLNGEVLYEIKTNSLIPFANLNADNICANMDLFFVKNLLEIIDGKIDLCKDENDFAFIKLCLRDDSQVFVDE